MNLWESQEECPPSTAEKWVLCEMAQEEGKTVSQCLWVMGSRDRTTWYPGSCVKKQLISNQITSRNRRGTNTKGNISLSQRPLYLKQFPISKVRPMENTRERVRSKAVTDSWYLSTYPFLLICNVGDAHAFDDEWQNEILKYQPRGQWRNLDNSRMRSVGHEHSGSRELKRR